MSFVATVDRYLIRTTLHETTLVCSSMVRPNDVRVCDKEMNILVQGRTVFFRILGYIAKLLTYCSLFAKRHCSRVSATSWCYLYSSIYNHDWPALADGGGLGAIYLN